MEYPDGRRFAVIGGKKSAVDSWFEMSWGDWLANYEQNVGSSVRLIHGFVPAMIEQGWGRIINTASVAASTALAEIPNYGAAKAAITNLTVSLSRALAGTGITVNTITPGIIRTPVVDGWFAAMGEQYGWGQSFEEIEPHMAELFDTSVKAVGRPSDIAAAVCLLASQQGGNTGANIRIEGGFYVIQTDTRSRGRAVRASRPGAGTDTQRRASEWPGPSSPRRDEPSANQRLAGCQSRCRRNSPRQNLTVPTRSHVNSRGCEVSET